MLSETEKKLTECLLRLDEGQKKSILSLIKSFFKPLDNMASEPSTSLLLYNKEIDEAMERIDKGEFSTILELENIGSNSSEEHLENNNMRQVTVHTTKKEYNHFIELIENLDYVKRIETDDAPTKEETLKNIKNGFAEMQMYNEGKLKTTSLNDFLNEL